MITADKNVFSTLNKKEKSILKHADPKWGAPSLFKASNIRSLLPKVLVTKPPPKNPLKQWQLSGQSGNSALRSVKSSFACLRAPGRHSKPHQNALAARYCETLCGSTVGVAQSPPPRHLPSQSRVDVRFAEVVEHTWPGRSLKYKPQECR